MKDKLIKEIAKLEDLLKIRKSELAYEIEKTKRVEKSNRAILRAIKEITSLTLKDIKQKARQRRYVDARMIYTTLLKRIGLSYRELSHFVGISNVAVRYLHLKHKDIIKVNKEYRVKFENIVKNICKE